jgi:hypothetical protein
VSTQFDRLRDAGRRRRAANQVDFRIAQPLPWRLHEFGGADPRLRYFLAGCDIAATPLLFIRICENPA